MLLSSLLVMISAAFNTINSTNIFHNNSELSFGFDNSINITVDGITFMGTQPQDVSSSLPPEWSRICRIQPGLGCIHPSTKQIVVDTLAKVHPTCILCSVRRGEVLRFESLRHILQISVVRKHYAVTIGCAPGGNITLPYPMRAVGLKYIHVQDCLIRDSMADYFNTDINMIPDTLVYYAIIDSRFYVDSSEFAVTVQNLQFMTKAAKCGPEKELMVAISRNISYVFSKIVLPRVERMKGEETPNAARAFYRGVSRAAFTCNYTKLIELDRSFARSLGSKHDSVLLQNSDFPALLVFNLSYSLLREVPGKFDDWRLYFPRMKIMDLTHNRINDFKSVLDYGTKTEDPSMGTLDLRYNNITTITLKQLRALQHHKYVKVDIRNNP
ncbi:uncharacterized protein, partial [Argopecten irradians]|uniref:uncharacterized protein n=1 Tax=Argopecten irradians TaxID=31199 RepID=UPI003717E9C1